MVTEKASDPNHVCVQGTWKSPHAPDRRWLRPDRSVTGTTLLCMYLGAEPINDRMHHHSEFKVIALPDWELVEILHCLQNVVSMSKISNESDSGVHNKLQR